MTQLEFSDTPSVIFGDIEPSIVEKFIGYHRANPQIYEQFKRFAEQIRATGRTHFSGKAIAERVRFESAARGDDGFKLNNSYVACMVRLLQFEDPNFRSFFETRSSVKYAA